MRNECNVIKELLPLYVENMVCDDTIYFIEEHVSKCEECRNKLNGMRNITMLDEPTKETINNDITNLKNFKKEWKRKNRIFIRNRIILILICVFIAISLLAVNFYKKDFTDTQGIHILGNWAHINYQKKCYLFDGPTGEIIGDSTFTISGILFDESKKLFKDENYMSGFSGHIEVSAYPLSMEVGGHLGSIQDNYVDFVSEKYIGPAKWEKVYWVFIMRSNPDVVVIHILGENVIAVCGENEEEALANYQYYHEHLHDD